MGQLATGLLSLSGWPALALLFMLPALEAPAFVGLVLPGELALLLGGVLAHRDRIPLVAALAVGVAGPEDTRISPPAPRRRATPRLGQQRRRKRPRRSSPSNTDHKRFREAVAVDREEQPC